MSTTETKESTKREIAVEVPADEVSRQTDALVQKYRKPPHTRIPQRARAAIDYPTTVFRGHQDGSGGGAGPSLFPAGSAKAGADAGFAAGVTDLHIHDGEPLKFKASFEVLPEIKVDGYKELARKSRGCGLRCGSG